MDITIDLLKQLIKEEMSTVEKIEEVSMTESLVIFEDAAKESIEDNHDTLVKALRGFVSQEGDGNNLISAINQIIYDIAEILEERDDYEELKEYMELPKYAIAVDSVLKKDEIAAYEDDLD